MATKIKAPKASTTALVTGLGETIEDITKTCATLSDALMAIVGGKLSKERRASIEEAAYKFGIAERRRRKLARKVGAVADSDD
jgi:hypothetical protein